MIYRNACNGFSSRTGSKREDREAQVIVLEKSGDVSYAACGMPYNPFDKDKPVKDLYALSLSDIRKERGIDDHAPVWDPILIAANKAIKDV